MSRISATQMALSMPEIVKQVMDWVASSEGQDDSWLWLRTLMRASLVCSAWWEPAQAAYFDDQRTLDFARELDYSPGVGWSAIDDTDHQAQVDAKWANRFHGSARFRKLLKNFDGTAATPLLLGILLPQFPAITTVALPDIQRLCNQRFFEDGETWSNFEKGNVKSLRLLLKNRVQDEHILPQMLSGLPKLRHLNVKHKGNRNIDVVAAALDSVSQITALGLEDEATLWPNTQLEQHGTSYLYDFVFDHGRLPSLSKLMIRAYVDPRFFQKVPSTLRKLDLGDITPCVALMLFERLVEHPTFLVHQEHMPFHRISSHCTIGATECDFALVHREAPRMGQATLVVNGGIEALRARGVTLRHNMSTILVDMLKSSFRP